MKKLFFIPLILIIYFLSGCYSSLDTTSKVTPKYELDSIEYKTLTSEMLFMSLMMTDTIIVPVGLSIEEVKNIFGLPFDVHTGFPDLSFKVDSWNYIMFLYSNQMSYLNLETNTKYVGQINASSWFYKLPPIIVSAAPKKDYKIIPILVIFFEPGTKVVSGHQVYFSYNPDIKLIRVYK